MNQALEELAAEDLLHVLARRFGRGRLAPLEVALAPAAEIGLQFVEFAPRLGEAGSNALQLDPPGDSRCT